MVNETKIETRCMKSVQVSPNCLEVYTNGNHTHTSVFIGDNDVDKPVRINVMQTSINRPSVCIYTFPDGTVAIDLPEGLWSFDVKTKR